MKKKIVFCSGGTGGHIFPAISLINNLSSENEIILVTDKRAVKYIDTKKYKIKILNVSSLTKNKLIYNLISLLKLFYSTFKSIFFLKKEKIDFIIGFGGYVSFPILLSAKILNKKIYLYEPNLVLGRTNRFFLSMCEKIFTQTNNIINIPGKHRKKFVEVGNIIREEIISYSINKNNFKEESITIIILGGSQGTKIFGEIVPESILKLKDIFKLKIIQQVLPEQKEKINFFYKKNNIQSHLFTFNENIVELIVKADLAISRSGASTIAELEFLQVPFIAVPYARATDNHQYENALYYKKKGSCWILEEKNFNSNNLSHLLLEILNTNSNFINKIEKNISKKVNFDVFKKIRKEMNI